MKPYRVETYDAYDAPADRKLLLIGEFSSPAAALAAAMKAIDSFLQRNRPDHATASTLYQHFGAFGEVPMILGDPEIPFDPYLYAEAQSMRIFPT